MKKQTITILDHETNETNTIEVEGFALLAVTEREKDGFKCAQVLDGVNTIEVSQMIVQLFEQRPEIKKAFLVQELGGVVGGMLQKMMGEQDDCDCENCVARRAEEAKQNESAQ